MAEILERGDVAFFYRPRVDEEDPEGLEDVQQLYLATRAHEGGRWRLLVVGRKTLPEPGASGVGRHWGFVDDAGDDPERLEQHLGEEEYSTQTRGQRRLPAARPAGEGVYGLASHGDHTHLAYVLELPEQPGEVQDDLGIEPRASYVVAVKNPETSSPPRAGLSPPRKAEYPDHLHDRFAGRRWASADPPELLDEPGAEFVLISAAPDPEEELDIDLGAEDESAASADIFDQLRIDREAHPLRPLFDGAWD